MKIAAFGFLVLAASAATFGFGGASWDWAKTVCWVFIALAALAYLGSWIQRRGRQQQLS